MNESYIRHGIPDSWGAQTHPMGYRADLARHAAEKAIAGVLNVVAPVAEWQAPARPRLERARARARG